MLVAVSVCAPLVGTVPAIALAVSAACFTRSFGKVLRLVQTFHNAERRKLNYDPHLTSRVACNMLGEELERSLNSVVSAVHESADGLRKRTIGTLEKMGSLGSFARALT